MADTGVTQLKRTGYFSAIDYWLLIPVLAITLIGLFVLNRVLGSGFEDYPQNLYKQIGAVLIGLALALILGRIELPSLRLVGYIIYAAVCCFWPWFWSTDSPWKAPGVQTAGSNSPRWDFPTIGTDQDRPGHGLGQLVRGHWSETDRTLVWCRTDGDPLLDPGRADHASA